MTTPRKDVEEAAKEYAARHYTVTGSDKQDSFLAGYAHRDAEVEALGAERDHWKWEYDNLCKFATQFEEQRDAARAEVKALKGVENE